MRKAITVLALIAFACDISRDVLVHGDPARKPEAAGRNDDYKYQMELHGQLDDVGMSRKTAEERERSDEPVGKWRSNGEALEPKWRDGDSVPLLPFSHYRSYSRDAVDDVEDFPATSRRPFKHRYSANRPRKKPGRRVLADDYDYEATYLQNRDYDNPFESYAHRRRRPLMSSMESFYKETIESATASSDGMRDRDLASDTLSDEVTSRYREAFQARPDEYEHEFNMELNINDEEYLRPRPRKRRPPQNYEFTLANEASDKENMESKDPTTLPSQKESEDLPMTATQSFDDQRKNTLELKSLLKMRQQEGLSLLEILQRKNITLSDLLKGKVDVNMLKSRMADESDEYVEEMSRVMSNSLMKLAATATLPWRPAQTSIAPDSTTSRTVATSSSPDNSIFKTTIIPENTFESRDHDEVFANNADRRVKDENVERKMQSARDFPRLRATTPAIVTTVITTSSPDAMSSVEYLLNDDGNVESTSDRTKLGALDEDEIMEFSDFTDFTKKSKSPTASTWSNPSGETIGLRDTDSTLSIERILNPTERIGLTKDYENAKTNRDEKIIRNSDRSVPTGESSTEDYNVFVEYQNDAPVDISEDDVGRNAMEDDSSANENRTASSADGDGKEMPRDKNHSSEYHQVNQSAIERSRNHEDRANSYARRYEDVISEIEPQARAEIFELFSSGSAGKRLERLLKSRNMSVEELIALRQRGSSSVHLTEIPRLKLSRNWEPILEISNKSEIIIFPKDSHEHFGARIKALEKEGAKQRVGSSTNQFKAVTSYPHNPFLDKDATNMSMSRLLDLAERDRDASRGAETSSENEYKPENSNRTIVNLFTPFAKNLQQQFEAEEGLKSEESKANLPMDNDNASTMLIDEERKTVPSNNSSELHAGYVEEITREAPTTIEITTFRNEMASRANGGDERKTLSRVRPSIIASGAILGVTIVVFLAIFIVCRIRQKQRYTYRNTFSRAVFQGPVMAARKLSNSSSLSTVMVNVVATSTAKRSERVETQEEFDGKCDMDNDSLDANDSWETIPDYAK